MRVWRTVAGFTALVGIMGIASADAQPARIILLRHGEKRNARELCDVGNLRAQALSAQYLGKGAPGNTELFGAGKSPDAFFAVTAHTKETAAPLPGLGARSSLFFRSCQKTPRRRPTSTRKRRKPQPPSTPRSTTARSSSLFGSTGTSPTPSWTRRSGSFSIWTSFPDRPACRIHGLAGTTTTSGLSTMRLEIRSRFSGDRSSRSFPLPTQAFRQTSGAIRSPGVQKPAQKQPFSSET